MNLKFIGIFCILFVIFTISNGNKEIIDFLLENVHEIQRPGIPGPLVVFQEPNAFPLVAGESYGIYRPVAAATENRMVAFGHTDYLLPLDYDTHRLLLNSVLYAAGYREPDPNIKIAIYPEREQLNELILFLGQNQIQGQFVGKEDLKNDTFMNSFNAICLQVFPGTINLEDTGNIKRFIESGKGIVAASTGWSWGDGSTELRDTDHPGNIIFGNSGIVWTRDYAYETTDRGTFNASYDFAQFGNLQDSINIVVDFFERNGTNPSPGELRAFDYLLHDSPYIPHEVAESIIPNNLIEHLNARQPVPHIDNGIDDPFQKKLLAAHGALIGSVDAGRVREHPSARYFPGLPATPSDGVNSSGFLIKMNKPTGKKIKKNTMNYRIVSDEDFIRGNSNSLGNFIRNPIEADLEPNVWFSTGLFIQAGRTLTVQILSENPPDIQIQIGSHLDDLSKSQRARWDRAPKLGLRKMVTQNFTMTSSFGGLVYLSSSFQKAGYVHILINGVIQAPYFKMGVTNEAEWRSQIRIRESPWTELEADSIILTLKSEHIRQLDFPEKVLRFWEEIMWAISDLYAVSRQRERAERIVTDVMPSAGYMHSGYPIVTHLDAGFELWDYDKLTNFSYINWGFFHELGHNHQGRNWNFEGTGEVTCNVFAMFIFNRLYGLPTHRTHEEVSKPRLKNNMNKMLEAGITYEFWKSNPWSALQIYYQLQIEFGWPAYTQVFAKYHEMNGNIDDNQEKIDTWIVTFSQVVNQNLFGLFKSWGFPTTEAAEELVKHLPYSTLTIWDFDRFIDALEN